MNDWSDLPCVLGKPDRDGYSRRRHAGRLWLEHRWTYTQVRGPVPTGMTLDHLCRRKNCVEPFHMEPVSLQENIRRARRDGAYAAGHAEKAGQSRCIHGHDPEWVRNGASWRCRACAREQQNRRRRTA